jgi:hypothetical protein
MRYQMSPAEFYHVRYRFKHAISTVAREKSNALCKYHYFFSLPLLKCLGKQMPPVRSQEPNTTGWNYLPLSTGWTD